MMVRPIDGTGRGWTVWQHGCDVLVAMARSDLHVGLVCLTHTYFVCYVCVCVCPFHPLPLSPVNRKLHFAGTSIVLAMFLLNFSSLPSILFAACIGYLTCPLFLGVGHGFFEFGIVIGTFILMHKLSTGKVSWETHARTHSHDRRRECKERGGRNGRQQTERKTLVCDHGIRSSSFLSFLCVFSRPVSLF